MKSPLKAYITGLVALSAVALVATSLLIPVDTRIAPVGVDIGLPTSVYLGIALWTVITLVTSALPVQLPNGTSVSVASAPIVAAMLLGGPTAAGWVALVGVTETREVRGGVPWYGTLFNHAGVVLPAIVGGLTIQVLRLLLGGAGGPFLDFVGAVVGASVYVGLNLLVVSAAVALRTGTPVMSIIRDGAQLYTNLVTLAPLSWLMAQMYLVAWWASLLFAVPLYTTRVAYHRFVEMREMFTQTIGALAEAVDKRDPFTSKHSENVRNISVAIGRVRKVSSADLDSLEWGGLLHDIGKIGVPDSVLLKPGRLTKEERTQMNAHPQKGAEIISGVKKLESVVPLIRHHHEWFNGSGYPARLVGMEIPELARILAVADAFEAMTAKRPYRMTPLTHAEALAELRRFAGIQFDPQMVEAFAKTEFARDVPDPARPNEPRSIPMIREVAEKLTPPAGPETGVAPVENS